MMGHPIPWRSAGWSFEYEDSVELQEHSGALGGTSWISLMSVPGIKRDTCMGREKAGCLNSP